MRAEFSESGVVLQLDPREYGFLFRCMSDRLTTLADWEVGPRLGMDVEEANAFVDGLLDVEVAARQDGRHWMPPRPDAGDEPV